MENTETISDGFDHFDHLSDDKLWDILDNFANDKPEQKIFNSTNNTVDKYNASCSECNSNNIVFTSSRGSYVCGNCGLESQEFLDDGPEWNNYDDGKGDSARCGAPSSAFFPKSSLGTVINTPGYSKVKMLRNWGQVPYRERSLAEVLNDIDSKCKKYKITKAVIDNAKILYKNVRETKHKDGNNKGKNVIIRGINRKQIIAACFYFGATLQKSPRSTKEVADVFNLSLKQVSKGCRRFLEIMKDNFIVFDIKPSHGTDFIERFGSKLKLSKESVELAKTIAHNTTKLDIASDHQATSIAAASILFASNILNQNINKKLVSEIFKISDVTIIKTYKKIYPFHQFVISDEKTTKLCHKMNLKLMTENIEEISDNESESSDLDLDPLESIDDHESDNYQYNNSIYEISKNTNSSNNDTNNTSDNISNINTSNTSKSFNSSIKTLNVQSFNIESETEKLIKKLYSSNIEKNVQIKNEPNINQSINLDESDIIKKDNATSKKNKLIQQQFERDKKIELKEKAKEEKISEKIALKEQKKKEKMQKKSQLNSTKYYEINLSDITENDIIIKKKRGRPKKNTNNNIINNIMTV